MPRTEPAQAIEQPVGAPARRGALRAHAALAEWEIAIVFAGCYLLLERVSLLHPWATTSITVWSPQAALALGLVLVRGARAIPALLLATLASEALMRQAPVPFAAMAFGAAAVTAGYALAGMALSRQLSQPGRIRNLRDLVWLLGIVALMPVLIGCVYVGGNALFGLVEWTSMPGLMLRYWIGDVVGVLGLMPFLLLLTEPAGRRKLANMAKRWETLGQLAAMAAVLAAVFSVLTAGQVKYFFVLFLPLVWMAARQGYTGAAAGLAFVQVGLIAMASSTGVEAEVLLELQARMLALCVTGLLLGVVVDERERAQESLRQSLRLAAAGEMAAALAHEVNQPLTALVTYGKACEHMLARTPPDVAQLEQTIAKLTEQAQRVGSIVKRLRDFLRSGTMNLERLAPAEFLAAMRGAFANEATMSGIVLSVHAEPDLPRVLGDRLELEIVLRNLIANALDAIRESSPEKRLVRLEAGSHEGKFVRLSVIDSGPGIHPTMRERLFQPFSTSKSHGMGLGLAISRAIVKAHGGRLWVEPAGHGAFHLTLPTSTGETDDGT